MKNISCQYDLVRVIQEKRKKLKRGTYEHIVTSKMEKLENKFAYSDEGKDLEEAEAMEIIVLTKEEEKGKISMKQDCVEGSTEKKKVKRPKLSKEHILQIVEHTQSMVNTQSIIQSYTDVKEKEIKLDKLMDTQSPQLISALEKDTQVMRIAIIQSQKAGDMLNEKITEFKFNMGQFSVVDKGDLF